MKNYDAFLIGNITIDEIHNIDGTTNESYGGEALFATYAMNAAGAYIGLLSKMKNEHSVIFDLIPISKEEVILEDSSVDTKFIYKKKNEEYSEYDDIEMKSLAGEFEINQVPLEYNSKVYYMAGILKNEFSLDMVKDLAKHGRVALNIKALICALDNKDKLVYEKDLINAKEYFPCVKYLKATPYEAELLTGESNLEKAAEALKSMGAKEIFIADDKYIHLFDGKAHYEADILNDGLAVIGVAETAFATYVARRSRRKSSAKSLAWAAAAASLKKQHYAPIKNSKNEIKEYSERCYSELKK